MISFTVKTAQVEDIYQHLQACDNSFIPSLSSRVNIKQFSEKIFKNTITFEAWDSEILVSLLSVYFNDIEKKTAFINNMSVMQNYTQKKIASSLINSCIAHAEKISFKQIILEVYADNKIALNFYNKFHFKQIKKSRDNFIILSREILHEDTR